MFRFFIACILGMLCVNSYGAVNAKNDPVLKALDMELKRSYPVLKSAEKTPLYFLAYEVTEKNIYSVLSGMGNVISEKNNKSRLLDIDVRYNNFLLDNTHQVKGESYGGGIAVSRQSMPLDDDIDALRASIWEYTDKAAKQAYEAFTKVQMNKAITAAEDDPSADFSPSKSVKFYETRQMPEFDKEAWKQRLNNFTKEFKKYPFIYDGSAWFSVETDHRYIVNSDGTRIKTGNIYITMSYSLSSLTDDGMTVYRGNQYHAANINDFPSDEKISADIKRSISELEQLIKAPVVEPFSGPAILNARAAGVYFHEIIGHRLEGHRQKLEDSGQTFAKKVNQKVTADFISLYDDPNLQTYNGTVLRGHYKYDDEGVKAQRVNLIENGVLKGFLMSRSPIKDFNSSNGHGRKSAGYQTAVSRMGNTVVHASYTVPYAELRKQLIDECKKLGKEFGLVFSDISGGFTMTNRGSGQIFKVNPLLVYKVYADGRPDEMVRGVDIVGTPIANFSKIIGAADDYSVFNGTCGAESGWVPVSAVAPSILISEIEVEKSQKSQEKQPVLNPPLHDK